MVEVPAMTLDEAIAHLLGKATNFNNGRVPTIKWVAETAMPKLHKAGEPTPSTYEKDVLDIDGALMFSLKSVNW